MPFMQENLKKRSRCAHAAIAAILLCSGLAVIWALCLPNVAYAYVDPSVMTYTIQALAGVAVALSAVAGVAFRRTRKALMKALGIDENAKKETDPDIYRVVDGVAIGPSDQGITAPGAADAASQSVAGKEPKKRAQWDALPWRKRIIQALIVALFCGFTLGIAAPFEIIAGAHGDLVYGVSDVALIMASFVGVCILALALVLSLFPKKAFPVVLVFAFSVGLACYVQSLVLNYGLPLADGREIDWSLYHTQMVVSTIVWAVIIIGCAVLGFWKRQIATMAVCALSIVLIIIQGAGVISLFVDEARDSGGGTVAVTDDGLYRLHPENNVVVFVLDCYDTKVFAQVLEEDPSIVAEMEGFTWYPNHAGVMIPTSFAVPYLLTGVEPAAGENMYDYLTRRYEGSNFLEDLAASGYSVGIYTDTFGVAYLTRAQEEAEIYRNTTNIHELDKGSFQMSQRDVVIMLARCALYRDTPWVLKPRFWFYTDELNWRCVKRPDAMSDAPALYSIDDSYFFDSLHAKGLTAEDTDYRGSFRFIHLLGAHEPYSLDEQGVNVGVGKSTQSAQAKGSMRMVGTYLNEMKRLGIYDDATIIITSDHGDWVGSMDMPEESTEPILLVKRAGQNAATWEALSASGENAAFAHGLLVSESPVSHAEFQGTVLEAMGENDAAFTTTYDTEFEPDRMRDFFHILHGADAHIYGLVKYEIQGDVRDFDNWTFTGELLEMDFNNNVR